jgi:hypothetical protein
MPTQFREEDCRKSDLKLSFVENTIDSPDFSKSFSLKKLQPPLLLLINTSCTYTITLDDGATIIVYMYT